MELSGKELLKLGVSAEKVIDLLEKQLGERKAEPVKAAPIKESCPNKVPAKPAKKKDVEPKARPGINRKARNIGIPNKVAQYFKDHPDAKMTIVELMDKLDPKGVPHQMVIPGQKGPCALYTAISFGLRRAVKGGTVKYDRSEKRGSVKTFSAGATSAPAKPKPEVAPLPTREQLLKEPVVKEEPDGYTLEFFRNGGKPVLDKVTDTLQHSTGTTVWVKFSDHEVRALGLDLIKLKMSGSNLSVATGWNCRQINSMMGCVSMKFVR